MDIATVIGRLSDHVTALMLSRHGDKHSLDLVCDKQGVVRKSQLAAIMATSRPMMVANLFNAFALIALEFSIGSLSALTLLWASLIFAFASYGYLGTIRYKRAPERETISNRRLGKIVISSCLLAIMWCYPFLIILPNGTLLEVAFVSGVTAGMIAGGALALYPVPLAGLLYTAVLSIGAVCGILGTNILPPLPFGIVILALAFVILFSVRRHTVMFLSELLGKLEAERQRDIVSLLMETIQGEGGQYLWRSDTRLNLKSDAQPLLSILGIARKAEDHENLVSLFRLSGLLDEDANL